EVCCSDLDSGVLDVDEADQAADEVNPSCREMLHCEAAVKSGCSRKRSIPHQSEWAANLRSSPEVCRVAAVLKSPLPDSNRRPPPYHADPVASGRNPWQRFWLISGVPANRVICH